MPKKKLIFSLFLVFIMSLVLTGCGGGGSSDETLNEIEKEEIRMEINNVINDFDTTDTTPQEEINKVDGILTSDAIIEVYMSDGTEYEWDKQKYLDYLAQFFAQGYEIVSQKIDETTKTINVVSSDEAKATFKITYEYTLNNITEVTSEVNTYYFVKINGNWYVKRIISIEGKS